jgi:hypothetical protein
LALRLSVAALVASTCLLVPDVSHAGTIFISSAPQAESGRGNQGMSGLDWCHGITADCHSGTSGAVQRDRDPPQRPQPAFEYDYLLILAKCTGATTNAPRQIETSASSPGIVSGGMSLPPLAVFASVALGLRMFPESPPGDRLLDPPRSLEFIPHELTECGD